MRETERRLVVVVAGHRVGFHPVARLRGSSGAAAGDPDRLNRPCCCPQFFERRGGIRPDRGIARMINLESIALVRIAAQAIASTTCVPTTSCSWAAPKRGSPRTRNSPQLISSNDTAIGSSGCVSPNIDSDVYARVAFRKRRADGSRSRTVRIAYDDRNGIGTGCTFGPMRKADGNEVFEPSFSLSVRCRHHEKRRRSDAHVRFPISIRRRPSLGTATRRAFGRPIKPRRTLSKRCGSGRFVAKPVISFSVKAFFIQQPVVRCGE